MAKKNEEIRESLQGNPTEGSLNEKRGEQGGNMHPPQRPFLDPVSRTAPALSRAPLGPIRRGRAGRPAVAVPVWILAVAFAAIGLAGPARPSAAETAPEDGDTAFTRRVREQISLVSGQTFFNAL